MSTKPEFIQADKTCRTIVGDLEHRCYVKCLRYSTAELVRICESDKENIDDETFELTSRLNAAGYDWRYDDRGKVQPIVREVEEARENRV